jgi:hypothetical protein
MNRAKSDTVHLLFNYNCFFLCGHQGALAPLTLFLLRGWSRPLCDFSFKYLS